MKNNITITNSSQFEEIINSLESSYNKIKKININENNNKEIINGDTDIWKGDSQVAMYNKYLLLSESFSKVEYSLEVYIKFLRKTLEDYTKAEQEINSNINQIANELDVNS